MKGKHKSILIKKINRRSIKKKSKSVSFKKKLVDIIVPIPQVGKSKKVNPHKKKYTNRPSTRHILPK